MVLSDDPLEWPRYAGLTPERYNIIRRVAGAALQAFHEDNEWRAWEEVSAITDLDEKLVLWKILGPHSSLRSCIKRMAQHAQTGNDAQQRTERQDVGDVDGG